ncbi:hypothetical protein GPECTOR_70g525 [Gonium pectorale]|uniref:Uncharacterized protein n=1 Tax=Gonium pectorale TaxID=33097 RepID=A0A150G398_GONPE|nr:hypothetical protein GPECTOR_70g525 [Gonium pectorale]|eukprot:KXZ44294.1 hypothetical protein GPECTOR_70g525 [Gonium pectorale]
MSFATEDAKRLMEYEVQLHGSCSAPLGLSVLNNAPTFGQQVPAGQGPTQAQEPAAGPSTSGPTFGGQSEQTQWSLTSTAAPTEGFRFGACAPLPAQQQGTSGHGGSTNPFARHTVEAGNDMETGA